MKTKGLNVDKGVVVTDKDMSGINKYTLKVLCTDDVFVFPVKLCDNNVDREDEKMTPEFLNQVAEFVNSKGLIGIKDHEWKSGNTICRVYEATITKGEGQNNVGEDLYSVMGKAYTLKENTEFIDNVQAGLLRETSISFESTGDTCSICGGIIGQCPHELGNVYDGKKCYNTLNNLSDLFEVSLVPVPCQVDAGIKNKSKEKGGNITMKKSLFTFLKVKGMKGMDEEALKVVEDALNSDSDELSEDDIKGLIDENTKLKAENSDLCGQLEALKGEVDTNNKSAVVGKAVDELKPINEKVKEMIMKELDLGNMKMGDDGVIEGLGDIINGLKASYKGLLTEEETKEEETEEQKQKALDDVKQELLNAQEINNKSKKSNFGINFGTGVNKKEAKPSKTKFGLGK